MCLVQLFCLVVLFNGVSAPVSGTTFSFDWKCVVSCTIVLSGRLVQQCVHVQLVVPCVRLVVWKCVMSCTIVWSGRIVQQCINIQSVVQRCLVFGCLEVCTIVFSGSLVQQCVSVCSVVPCVRLVVWKGVMSCTIVLSGRLVNSVSVSSGWFSGVSCVLAVTTVTGPQPHSTAPRSTTTTSSPPTSSTRWQH